MRFARGVGATAAVQVVGIGAAAAGAILLARVLGPEGKGLVSFALFVGTLGGFLLTLGLDQAATYFAAARAFPVGRIASSSLAAAAGLGLIGAAALGAARAVAGPWAVLPDAHLAAAAAALAAFPVAAAGRGVLFGTGRIPAANWNGILPALLVVPLLAIAATGGALTPGSALGLYAVVHLAAAAAAAALAGPAGPPSARYLRAAAPYGLAAYAAGAAAQAHYRLDVLLLGGLAGAADVGLYASAVALVEILWVLAHAASWILLPRVAADRAEASGLAPAAARVVLAATALGALLLGAAAPAALGLLFGEAFVPAAFALRLLLPGIVAGAHGKIVAATLAGLGDPRPIARAAATALAANVVLNLLAIPRFGIEGAAAASSATYLLQAFLLAAALRRRAPQPGAGLLLPRADDARALRAVLGGPADPPLPPAARRG